MPTYEVRSPDGTAYRVNAPEGATQEDAIAYVQKNFTAPKQVDMPAPSKGFGQQLGDAIADGHLTDARKLGRLDLLVYATDLMPLERRRV